MAHGRTAELLQLFLDTGRIAHTLAPLPHEKDPLSPRPASFDVVDANGLSWSSSYGVVVGKQEASIAKEDAAVLRSLARRIAEIAADDAQARIRQLWLDHNSLLSTRPLVFCDPERAWYEIIPPKRLLCGGSLARIWEFKLRKELFWAERIRDDRVIEKVFRVHQVYAESDRGLAATIVGDRDRGAIRWDAPLHDYAALPRLKARKLLPDPGKTSVLLTCAQEVFQGILEVRLEGAWWWSLGMTNDLILLRGFEQALYDLHDYPKGFHALMAFLRDENLEMLDFLERQGLLSLNNGGDFIGTGGYGWSRELPGPGFDGTHVRARDMWGFCESQETVGVSPEQFAEFVFAYQLPILERFGLNIYGCCEPLDSRWEIVRRIPRLRKVTVSPWSDVHFMAERLGNRYILCKKVNPARVSVPHVDEEALRAELRETFQAAARNDCRTQVLLRDLVSLGGNPENAVRWTAIAREESDRI